MALEGADHPSNGCVKQSVLRNIVAVLNQQLLAGQYPNIGHFRVER